MIILYICLKKAKVRMKWFNFQNLWTEVLLIVKFKHQIVKFFHSNSYDLQQ